MNPQGKYPKFNPSSHYLVFVILTFAGFWIGSTVSWVVAVILSELEIIHPPAHVLVIGIGALLTGFALKQ